MIDDSFTMYIFGVRIQVFSSSTTFLPRATMSQNENTTSVRLDQVIAEALRSIPKLTVANLSDFQATLDAKGIPSMKTEKVSDEILVINISSDCCRKPKN